MGLFFQILNWFYEKKELELLPLFKQFIRDTRTGRRLKINGERIKPQTVRNYEEVLKLLDSFCVFKGSILKVRLVVGRNGKLSMRESNRWKRFYFSFCNYLYDEKNCFDNYVGLVVRVLKAFFRYLRRDRLLEIGGFHQNFYAPSEEIDVIALSHLQLRFLIQDRSFESKLSARLQLMKDIFVFGCTVALRSSDLFRLSFQDIRKIGSRSYLSVKSRKTGVRTTIRLPDYLIEIIDRLRMRNPTSVFLFPKTSIERFNVNIKRIGELAGWREAMPKVRYRRGKPIQQLSDRNLNQPRFCDRLSTHVMRKTAITTMLMLGMPELLVRKISGHSPNSREFYRYVNFAQELMDNQIEKMYRKLLG